MQTENEITHDGHRGRLTDLVLNSGLDNVSEIQAVEFFLTYIFPRGDVNPLAHRLLKKYGNFFNIINASISDLTQVKGINERSAKKIKLFEQIINYYTSCRLNKRISLKNNKEFLKLLEGLLRYKTTENLYLLAIDHSFSLIQKRCYDLKMVREVGISPYEIYNLISSTKLSYLVIVHNHPNGTARPSPDDHDANKFIEMILENFECKLLDSYIVGCDGIYSENQESFVKHFDDNNIIDFA